MTINTASSSSTSHSAGSRFSSEALLWVSLGARAYNMRTLTTTLVPAVLLVSILATHGAEARVLTSRSGAHDPAVTLRGPLGESGRAEVRVSYPTIHGTPAQRVKWRLTALTVDCQGRREVAENPLVGYDAIAREFAGDHRFGSNFAFGDLRHPVYAGKVRVTLLSPHRARGWTRVYGSAIHLRGGGTAACDSGRVRFDIRAVNNDRLDAGRKR